MNEPAIRTSSREWARKIVLGLAMPPSEAAEQFVASVIDKAREEAYDHLQMVLRKTGVWRTATLPETLHGHNIGATHNLAKA